MIINFEITKENINKLVQFALNNNIMKNKNAGKNIRFIIKKYNITHLTNNILDKIDNDMAISLLEKTPISDSNSIRYSSVSTCIFRKIISSYFGYKFKRCDMRSEESFIPFKYFHEYENNNKVKEIIDKFASYLSRKKFKDIRDRISIFINNYKNYIDKIYDKSISREEIIEVLQNKEDNSNNDRKTRVKDLSPDAIDNQVRSLLCCVNSAIDADIFNVKKIKFVDIVTKEKNIILQDKDYFNEEELNKIADSYIDDKERLIFTLFLTTGIRLGGLINIKIKDLYSDDMTVKNEGMTLEKKHNKIRRFVIFPALKQALEKYRDSYGSIFTDKEYALFPKYDYVNKNYMTGSINPINEQTIENIIKTICNRAGINGDHTHPHAIRKTVVINLMSEGNTLDSVAKFIGHSSSNVTAKHYWTPTQNDLIKTMNLSWLVGNSITDLSESSSSDNTNQMNKIATMIIEGVKAKKRLEHAVSLLSKEQLNKMESLWTDNVEEEVSALARSKINAIVKYAESLDTRSIRSTIE